MPVKHSARSELPVVHALRTHGSACEASSQETLRDDEALLYWDQTLSPPGDLQSGLKFELQIRAAR